MPRLEKFFRRFEPPISEPERQRRLTQTREIIVELTHRSEWCEYIEAAWIFGSLVKDGAKTGSDIDVAIRTPRHTLPGDITLGRAVCALHMKSGISVIKEEWGLHNLSVHPQVVPGEWFDETPTVVEGYINTILRDGIKIV